MLGGAGARRARLEGLRGAYRERAVVLVSHGDVIKSRPPLPSRPAVDAYGRIEVEPASVSTLVVGDWGAKVMRLNEAAAA
jgi:probable phosphoglycerate mutase